MKRVKQFLFLLTLLFSISGSGILPQEQPSPQQFPLGVWGTGADYSELLQYQKILESGYNWIVQGVYPGNQSLLENFNVITQNANEGEWIYHYSNGMYTKWQAERDEYAFLETGFKHPPQENYWGPPDEYRFGSVQTLKVNGIDHICWATDPSVTGFVDSVLWGPNYRQDKNYRLDYLDEPIEYNVNYNLAFIPPEQFNPTTPVCSIYVNYRYVETNNGIETNKDMVLASDIITEGELSSAAFTNHSLTYSYPEQFRNPISGPIYDGRMGIGNITYDDTDTLMGIEFRLDWFGVGQLFIDYVEVYDAGVNGIWDDWVDLELRPLVINNIQSQLSNYSTAEWPNIKYWYVRDEPQSIDYYEPMRIVDSLVNSLSNNTWRTLNQFMPQWNGANNGDPTIQKFKQLKDPAKIMMDYFPFWVGDTDEKGFELLRQRLIELYQNDPDFFYVPQGFGQFTTPTFEVENECQWRYPTPEELKGSVMLALAHGAKGILFWKFATNDNSANTLVCGDVYFKALAGNTEEGYVLYPMGQMIKDNLAPRLNGILGTTLMNLSYIGNDLMLRDVTDPTWAGDENYSNISYLTLTNNPVNNPINSTLNFFATDLVPSTNDYSNNYFLMTNLITDDSRVAEMNVQSSENVNNTRLRIIEPEYNFDITFFDDTTVTYSFPPGEGYLFQVAPVAIYGGKLIYDEYVNTDITLYDDMTIENGAILTLEGDYYCKGNITIKDGGSIKTLNGATIQFESGKKLIIEGLATVKGTSTHKLTLDFTDPNDNTGIEVLTDGDFTISNCIVKNASTGVLITTNVIPHTFENLNINNTTFDNCTAAVNIIGSPINDAKIKNCIITNTPTGITVAYNNKITIQSNTITNSELGIFLEQTSNSNVISNQIISNLNSMPGILLSSAGGHLRANIITGHTIGISLANSSPKIGGNTIYGNLINGIYISASSQPDLRPALAGNPPNMYPLSGYNIIKENGGYEATTLLNDDGSEIFINDGFIKLGDGCNQIMDDRNQDQNLIETLLLMNSNPLIPVSTIKADTNYWSTINFDPSGRFGNLTVQYQPYLVEPCILPQSGGQMLITQSSTGDVIDTLYSSGVDVGTLTGIDALYAQADQYYITAQTEQAKTVYEQIITDYPDDPKSIYAYSAVFMLTRLSGDSTQFSALRELYQQRLTTVSDTLLSKTLSQLSALCLINEQNYQSAISYFEEIMNSNPNTDAALFAEIDALTTSMIAGPDTTQLGKGTNNRILVKGTADYLSKVNNLLKGRFGYQKPEEEKIIPEQYFLYQNYPNPFNPTTSIKFDLPQAGNVELIVYDILGRKVKQLLNETKPAGSYEVEFNASNLASGVYIYTIKSNDFTASKKLMLLK